MRVQAPIVIPGEHFTSPNAGRSEHSEQREECSGWGDSRPHGPPPEFARFAHEFDLPALGEVKEIAAIRATASPRESFCCEADFNDQNVVEALT